MTKYTSNERYERDKADWLYHLEIHLNEGLNMDALDVVDIFNLLKQSEWVVAKSQMLAEIYCLADDIAQDLNYNNEYCSPRANEAIGQAILKAFKIMELIDDG